MANLLAYLVRIGVKTATTSALSSYEEERSPLPQRGELSIVVDGNRTPVAVIETVQVSVKPFIQITADFAYKEREGDRSLAYCGEARNDFFTRHSSRITFSTNGCR